MWKGDSESKNGRIVMANSATHSKFTPLTCSLSAEVAGMKPQAEQEQRRRQSIERRQPTGNSPNRTSPMTIFLFKTGIYAHCRHADQGGHSPDSIDQRGVPF